MYDKTKLWEKGWRDVRAVFAEVETPIQGSEG